MKEIHFNEKAPALLREYLRTRYPLLTAGGFARALETKAVRVNGEKAGYNTRLSPGDRIQLYLPDDILAPGGEKAPPWAAAGPVEPIFEDDAVLVANKPAGLLCPGDTGDTLLTRCRRYLAEKGEDGAAALLCHRLDRGTAGLVMVAKNAPVEAAVRRQMDARTIEKTYICAVLGSPPKKADTVHAFLRKDSKAALCRVFTAPVPGAMPIETTYRVLAGKGGLSLLSVVLGTGRTHQIRAQMAALGCPVLGDGKYGREGENRRHRAKYQALCARRLAFSFTEKEEPLLAGLAGKTLEAPAPWFEEAFYAGTL